MENGNKMTQTRHTAPHVDPANAQGLRADHPALSEARTLFPKSVVSVDDSERLLVSGHNNVKLGAKITRGEWAGFPVYQLSLEERATCPTTCAMWSSCYGNTMPFARRHSHDDPDALMDQLDMELADLQKKHAGGFAVRLHTLGDFFSVEYVDFWGRMLRLNPALHVFGYTARQMSAREEGDREIASMIHVLREIHWDRFAIRTSSEKEGAMRAVVYTEAQADKDIIMCPAQTKDSECCATCGLCWSPSAQNKTIGFLKHGITRWSPDTEGHTLKDYKPISEINIGRTLTPPAKITTAIPKVIMLPFDKLVIDTRYQRVILAAGRSNIRHIVENFDWMHFQPILVSPVGDGTYAVVDGQHRAIAAYNHPDVGEIPAAVVELDPKQQAHVFAEINSRIVKVNALEIYWARYASGDEDAQQIMDCVEDADLTMIRVMGKSKQTHEVEKFRNTFWMPNMVGKCIGLFGFGFTSSALDFVRRWDNDIPVAPNTEHIVMSVARYLHQNSITDYEHLIDRLAGRFSYEDVRDRVAEIGVRDRRHPQAIFYADILVPALQGGQVVAA